MNRVRVNKAMREELIALCAKRGKLNAAIVIEASKKKSSAMHKMFMWDDPDAAAALGRKALAEGIICNVRILPSEAERMKCSVKIRQFYGTGYGYRSVKDVFSDASLREAVLQRALNELATFQERYQALQELAEVFKAADKLRRKRGKKNSRRPGPAGP